MGSLPRHSDWQRHRLCQGLQSLTHLQRRGRPLRRLFAQELHDEGVERRRDLVVVLARRGHRRVQVVGKNDGWWGIGKGQTSRRPLV